MKTITKIHFFDRRRASHLTKKRNKCSRKFAEKRLKSFESQLISELNSIVNSSIREYVRLAIGEIVYRSLKVAEKKAIECEFSSSEEGSDSDAEAVSSMAGKNQRHVKMFAKVMTRELRRFKYDDDRSNVRLVVTKFVFDCVNIARKQTVSQTGNDPATIVENMVISWLTKYDPNNRKLVLISRQLNIFRLRNNSTHTKISY